MRSANIASIWKTEVQRDFGISCVKQPEQNESATWQ